MSKDQLPLVTMFFADISRQGVEEIFSLRINLSTGSDRFYQCEKMKRDQILDILNFLVSLAIFVLPTYSVHIGLPLLIQVFPAVLLVIPLTIVLYRRRIVEET